MPESDGPQPRHVSFEAARLALARVHVETAAGLGIVIANAARICADAIDVERVSVWKFDEDREQLRCLHLYERSKSAHSSGEVLQARAFTGY